MALIYFYIVVLFTYAESLKDILEVQNLQVKLTQDDPNLSPDSDCTIYRDNLASAVSTFTSCAIVNSRPITLCESCVDAYINVLDSYKNLSTSKTSVGYCIDDYVNLDRLQIVEGLYRNSYDLWHKAKCYECFEIVNNTLTNNISEETLMFNILLNGTLSCINDHNETTNNQTFFCSECISEYLGLNSYYKSISDVNDKIGVCMDIVDLMNGTRALWSDKCCEYRKRPEFIFLGSTCAVTLVTILFYIMTKYCTDLKSPSVLRRK